MPEVKDFYKKCIKFKDDGFKSIKLLSEIHELKNSDYEFVHHSSYSSYFFFFELDSTLYCMDILFNNDFTEGDCNWVYECVDKEFKKRKIGKSENIIENLSMKIPKFVLEQSVERIRFLLKGRN